jgi:ubiquinone/menaquinone biosynthesis C-methylase UbiE
VNPSPSRPDYGIDAPGVVRNLFLAAGVALVPLVTAATGVWSGVLTVRIGGARLVFPFVRMAPGFFTWFSAAGVWMLWNSRIGKLRSREALLNRLAWSGGERVLDVGCGRGLMMIGAAGRLTTGNVTGIDLWQAEDLSGNRPEATLENARRAGVLDRVDVRTGDMCRMPFPDAEFDVVLSRAAIHNLYDAARRRTAIGEICRVLKPGGVALIDDVRHGGEYAAAFREHGCADVRHLESKAGVLFTQILTMGSLRPATLLARKDVR